MNDQTPAHHQHKLAMSKREVTEQLGVSLSFVDKLIASGELPHRKTGRRVLIPYDAVRAFLEGK